MNLWHVTYSGFEEHETLTLGVFSSEELANAAIDENKEELKLFYGWEVMFFIDMLELDKVVA